MLEGEGETANLEAHMNATPKPSGSGLVSRIKPVESSEERPLDREQRRLRGLSADVGAACSAWLANRGIKARTWGNFNMSRLPSHRSRLELSLESDS